MSQEQNRDQFDSLSGTIVDYNDDIINLHVPYSTGQLISADLMRIMSFKIIGELCGVGLQITADLIKITNDSILCLRLNSALEAFKRFEMPRIDSTFNVFHHREDTTLSTCKSKFHELVEREKKGLPLNIMFRENQVNVSASGIRIVTEAVEKSFPLALCALDLGDGKPPVCAITETAWIRRFGPGTVSGHRFLTILKSDQERISRYVISKQRSMGLKPVVPKKNWALLDRMTFQTS
jgi:hypothetical protein